MAPAFATTCLPPRSPSPFPFPSPALGGSLLCLYCARLSLGRLRSPSPCRYPGCLSSSLPGLLPSSGLLPIFSLLSLSAFAFLLHCCSCVLLSLLLASSSPLAFVAPFAVPSFYCVPSGPPPSICRFLLLSLLSRSGLPALWDLFPALCCLYCLPDPSLAALLLFSLPSLSMATVPTSVPVWPSRCSFILYVLVCEFLLLSLCCCCFSWLCFPGRRPPATLSS